MWADAHIFVYHRFADERYPSTSTSLQELKDQFEFFKINGYEVIRLKTLVDALIEKKPISDKWVVLTIDDGYKSFYENGLNIFKEYGYPFTLFVYAQASKSKYGDFMTVPMLKDTQKYGELGLHTYSHPHMTHLSNEEVEQEMEKGIEFFQKKLGFTPEYFAYPYGEFDERIQSLIKKYNFKAILNQNMGAVSKKSDRFNLDRSALTQGAELQGYLDYDYLQAHWIEPKMFPKSNTLKSIHIQTDSKQKNGKLYITGLGWQDVTLDNGDLQLQGPFHLKNSRSRIILKINNQISNHLLVK